MTEVRLLKEAYERCEHFYVLNDKAELSEDMRGRTYFIRHSERDWLLFTNIFEAWRILRNKKPDLILSTGAGPAVPFTVVGKLLGIRSIFIETFTRVTKPSLTGRIMYRLADRFFYQWRSLEKFFPKGVYSGPVI